MNLHQFRVLSAVLRLPDQFTTPDLVREAGVSAEVVRKTYQRYTHLFTVEEVAKPKVRSLTPEGREKLLHELKQNRSHLPPPPVSRGPEGEPLGLAAAERVLYELIPASNPDECAPLIREVRSHLELADQECWSPEGDGLTIAVEVRLEAAKRMLQKVEVLHDTRAQAQLERRIRDTDLSNVSALAGAVINAMAAQDFARSRQQDPVYVCDGLSDLFILHERAPEESNRIADAMALAKEPAWCKALGIKGSFWNSYEATALEMASHIASLDNAAKYFVMESLEPVLQLQLQNMQKASAYFMTFSSGRRR
jgi:hypothetical protein